MWENILNAVLDFFANINEFSSWLFTKFDIYIEKTGDWYEVFYGWFIDWVNGWNISITPIEIFSISTFTILFGIWIIKMII